MKKIVLLSVLYLLVACSPKTFTVVQIADAQLGFDAAVKGSKPGAEYVNDLTFEVECLKATVAKVNELKPDAIVFTGDQVHLPYNIEQWDAFMQIIAGIDPSIKVYHLPGNHDHILRDGTADPADFIERFGSDHFAGKQGGSQCTHIRRQVDHFYRARCTAKIHLGKIAKNQQQKCAGAGTVKSVVQADHQGRCPHDGALQFAINYPFFFGKLLLF